MQKPLRILTIMNLPWDRRLGAARIWIDLSEQWKNAGQTVERFCLTDAFPLPTKVPALSAWRDLLFPGRAARYVHQNARRFDVIDCLIGTLPFSKKQLGFDGLLVARSVGLYRPYQEFIRFSRERWPDQPRGKLLGRLFYRFLARRLWRNSDLALQHCDLINLLNEDEKTFLNETTTPHKPMIVQPSGLNERERAAFAGAMRPANFRLQGKEICFIGMWGLRKGARDWPEIIRHIRTAIPDTRFLFLGTMTSQAAVFKDLHLPTREGVRCIETYNPEELPGLLAPCAVGIFPSYIEGFGVAVLEQLACGIPTIAYDVPGPRQILKAIPNQLTPSGDAKAIATRAVAILNMSANEYASLSAQCRAIAEQYRWEQVAANTAREYAAALELLRDRRRETKLATV